MKNTGYRQQKNTDRRVIPNKTFTSLLSSRKNHKSATEEINEWFNTNIDLDFKLISYWNNYVNITITLDTIEHKIKIVYPNDYPETKKGYMITEVYVDKITPLNFINKINTQCQGKILTLSRILSHLLKTHEQYKLKYSSQEKDVLREGLPLTTDANQKIVFCPKVESDENNWFQDNEDVVIHDNFTIPDKAFMNEIIPEISDTNDVSINEIIPEISDTNDVSMNEIIPKVPDTNDVSMNETVTISTPEVSVIETITIAHENVSISEVDTALTLEAPNIETIVIVDEEVLMDEIMVNNE